LELEYNKVLEQTLTDDKSILTEDICSWLYAMGFAVSISHDGPGQFVRGPDPFEDEETKKLVLEMYEVFRPEGRMSFNAMMNSKNTSRKIIQANYGYAGCI
jgi:uncharacterized protein